MKHSIKPALAVIALLSIHQLSQAQKNNTSDQIHSAGLQTVAYIQGMQNVKNNSGTLDNIPESNPELNSAFSKLFPAASQQQWAQMDKGYYVSFVDNGRKIRAGFDLKGRINYTISDCTTEQLPPVIRNEIEKNYSTYNLIQSIEINAHNQMTYQVVLENTSSYITLKTNGEVVEKTGQVNKTTP